jgi:hypothetical protein
MKSISELTARLETFGKQASSKQASADPTTVTDPAESGGPATPSGDNLRAAEGPNGIPGAAATLATTTEGGGLTAPATQDFVEPGKLATDFQSAASAIREKLASASWFTPPAPAASTPGSHLTVVPAPEKCASEPGAVHLKIAAHLLDSERGRVLVSEALEEVLGKEAAAELVKAASSEQQQFEKEYLVEKLAAAEQAEKYANAYAAHVEMELASEELIKQATAGMSGPEAMDYRDKVATSAQIIQRAEESFIDHPQALADFTSGVMQAHKYAAAVEAGADPAAAMAAGDPAAAGMPPEAGGAGGEEAPPSPEEIQAALIELIQAGIITEEQAEQLFQAVAQGGGAPPPGAEGGLPPGAEGGAPPEGELPPEEAAKVAAIDAHLVSVAAIVS